MSVHTPWNKASARLQQQSETDRILFEEPVAVDDHEEFIRELESRGLIASRVSSRWTRFVRIIRAPFRLVSRMLARLAWHLYAKAQHERAVRETLEKWKRNAGLLPRSDSVIDKIFFEEERSRRARLEALLSTKPTTNAGAEALHADIIRNTVRKLPLPPPDVDDPVVPTAECMLMSESDMCLPLTTSTIPPKG